MNPLLTIIVPTWNRRKNLQELLPILLPELDRQPDIDLLVSNNASPDDTAAYLNSLPSHPRLRVIHQPINYGSMVHLAWLYGQAEGRWFWMICDDDLVTPDAVAFVCATLRARPELGWVHLPHKYPSDVREPLCSRMPASDTSFAKGREAFATYTPWFTFVTSNVIRSTLLQQRLPRFRLATDFWPMGLLMEAVAEEAAFVPARCLVHGGWEISWADRRVEVMHCGFPTEILLSRVLNRSEKAACLRQWYRTMPDHLSRLVVLSPALLARILLTEPRLVAVLLGPSGVLRIFRLRFWRQLSQRLARQGRKGN